MIKRLEDTGKLLKLIDVVTWSANISVSTKIDDIN